MVKSPPPPWPYTNQHSHPTAMSGISTKTPASSTRLRVDIEQLNASVCYETPRNRLATARSLASGRRSRAANGMPAARRRPAQVVDPRHEPDPAHEHIAKRGDQHTDD